MAMQLRFFKVKMLLHNAFNLGVVFLKLTLYKVMISSWPTQLCTCSQIRPVLSCYSFLKTLTSHLLFIVTFCIKKKNFEVTYPNLDTCFVLNLYVPGYICVFLYSVPVTVCLYECNQSVTDKHKKKCEGLEKN